MQKHLVSYQIPKTHVLTSLSPIADGGLNLLEEQGEFNPDSSSRMLQATSSEIEKFSFFLKYGRKAGFVVRKNEDLFILAG